MNTRNIFPALLALALLAGCMPVPGDVTAPPQPGLPTASSAAAEADAATPAPAVDLLPTVAPAPAGPAAPVAEADVAVLRPEALRSYLAKTEVRVETLTPETRVQAWTRSETRAVREGAAGPLTAMTVTDLTGSETGETSRMILAPGVVFMRGPNDPKWLRLSDSGGAAIAGGALGPDEIAAYSQAALTEAAVVASDEEIEGVATTHYQIVGPPLAAVIARMSPQSGELVSGQMDLWIAGDGYVKQVIQDYVVKDATGTQTRHMLTMLILEENAPAQVALPGEGEYEEMTMPAPPTMAPVDVAPTATAG